MYGIFLKHFNNTNLVRVPALAEIVISDEHEGPWESTHLLLYLTPHPPKNGLPAVTNIYKVPESLIISRRGNTCISVYRLLLGGERW